MRTQDALPNIIDQAIAADIAPIRDFLFSNPSEPLIASGSGGVESAAEFMGLLYGAHGVNPESPKNPGKIDKRVPMWAPFKAELKRSGPLKL